MSTAQHTPGRLLARMRARRDFYVYLNAGFACVEQAKHQRAIGRKDNAEWCLQMAAVNRRHAVNAAAIAKATGSAA